ncbi:hypothetical protein SAMN05216276_1017102 [Streptosporangium subroseum]|uniref:Uncharacterized protein n=1 Tax=Streptosporangium subroseum TaxID=106412 RepID=A0A239HRC6_9ACTN|nr:hypothetical protein [Streptosporangium subroseum]SNS83872.1 hypothetical protein SAMN05216276_1017102 [Streptosporangium subroseum]
MDRRRHLLLSPALLAVLALGTATGPQFAVAPVSARVVAANIPQSTATTATADPEAPEGKPKAYRDAYRKGYTDAGKDCSKPESFSYNGSDLDRKGWVDGYNAGHANLCGKSS